MNNIIKLFSIFNLLIILIIKKLILCEEINNDIVLSTYSDFPNYSSIKKFDLSKSVKDPVYGDLKDNLIYNELRKISKEIENDLINKIPKNRKLGQYIPVELFCSEMYPIFRCLLRNISETAEYNSDLKITTNDGLTWLLYKGSHAKVAIGYMTTPSNITKKILREEINNNLYNNKDLLAIDKSYVLRFNESSEFSKYFKPISTKMSDLYIYFHGNKNYNSGWVKDGTTIQVAIKTLVRGNLSTNIYLWDREREYTLFLSSSELWRTTEDYINFVPGIFSLYSIKKFENKRLKSNNYVSNSINIISELIIPDFKGKEHFSEFLIMEYSKGMKFTEVIRRLKSRSAVYYYGLTDWENWFKNSLYLIYIGLSIISTFSMTGRYLYLHCDLHGDNIIISNISSNIFSRILFTNMQELIKIENIKIIDHMFIWTPKNSGSKSRSNPCNDINEISLSDIECFTALILGPLLRLDYYPFDQIPENTDNYLQINKKTIDLFNYIMNIPEWRRISSYYVGGATKWFKKWKSFGKQNKDIVINTFNEQFEGIMLVCDYLHNFLYENHIPQKEACIQFHSYLRGYTMLNYRAMRIGYCIRKNIQNIFNYVEYNQKQINNHIEISYWDLSRLTLLFYWNLLITNIQYCLPIHNQNYIFTFNENYQVYLNERHCTIIKDCLNQEDQLLEKKYSNLQKVNININKYYNIDPYYSPALKNSYNLFIKSSNNINYNNSNINKIKRDIKNFKYETIIKLNGKIATSIPNKFSNIIETKQFFDYEEFLLDRWIFSLYYQSSLSLSFTLIGIRYSFRIEPSLSGKKGLNNFFIKSLKKSAQLQNLLSKDEQEEISEFNLLKSCNMFYKVYYEIAIKLYENQIRECKQVVKRILSDPNYILFKQNSGYLKYYQEINNMFFEKDGKQKLNIINPNNICSYDYFDPDSNVTLNNEIIYQGFCNILIKPLSNIKIKIN